MKIAIIGGGPAAFGALARLVDLKHGGLDVDIDVFTTGDTDQEQRLEAAYKTQYTNQDINTILKAGKASGKSGALPPRSFHGQVLQDHAGHGGLRTNIKVSDTFGGIGNYWSGSVFPTHTYTDPIAGIVGDLSDHYRFIAERIPVAGPDGDELGAYFDETSINHPPISVADKLARLKCPATRDMAGLELAIGVNRFALNTLADQENGCIECGDCMYGCPRDALFRAAKPIDQFARDGACRIVYEKVSRVKNTDPRVELSTPNGKHTYDKVLICTGALGSVELLGRSYGTPQKPVELYDNLLWYFPAVSLWPQRTRTRNKTFAFAELAGGIFDHADQSYNHLLVSTLPGAVMDNLLGRNGFSKALTELMSNHLIIAAMYGSHEEFIRYSIDRVGDEWKAVSAVPSTDGINAAKFALYQNHLARHGWYTSRRLAMENGTSGHYSANLGAAYGIESLARTGAFAYNVFICDSSSWNAASMSQQHTFTVMANASRIAQTVFSHLDG